MNTIVALATPVGRSAIGVLRLSGPGALAIAQKLCLSSLSHGSVSLCKLVNPNTNEILDRALVSYFAAPRSYTGEDVVEISCHGSAIVLRQVLDLTLELGARLAEPGEFTLRAVANRKINLSQAEAIRDLIDARTAAAAKQALRQLDGELSTKLSPIKEELLEIIVLLESALEFAEEDLPLVQQHAVTKQLLEVARHLNALAGTFASGHLLSQGLRVAIVGCPNVGKSSLFNKLVGLDRAIVTAIPGTTRDSIGEQVSIDGTPVTLVDTAGMRESEDHIESIGIERTRSAIADADLVLAVLDGSRQLSEEDEIVLTSVRGMRHIVVVNKSDVPEFADPRRDHDSEVPSVTISALTGVGLDELRAAMLNHFKISDEVGSGLLITNARHHDLLKRAHAEVLAGISGYGEVGDEVVLVSLQNALRSLDEITGETTAEDVLARIFSTFCIGK